MLQLFRHTQTDFLSSNLRSKKKRYKYSALEPTVLKQSNDDKSEGNCSGNGSSVSDKPLLH